MFLGWMVIGSAREGQQPVRMCCGTIQVDVVEVACSEARSETRTREMLLTPPVP